MNKIKPLLLALCAIALTGVAINCAVNIYYSIKDHTDYSSTFTHRGHSYVLVHANGTNAVTHDPDCPCHQKGGEDETAF